VKQYPGERATLDGNPGASTGAMHTTLRISGSYTWYWDFEVTNSHPARLTTSTSAFPPDIYRGNAIDAQGNNIKLIHVVTHDNADGIAPLGSGGLNLEVYGAISYNNGWYSSTSTDGYGHGFYIQNDTGIVKNFTNNIVFNNFALGFQGYGSAGSVSNLTFSRNIAFNSASPIGLFNGPRADNYRWANILLGNASLASTNIVLDSNRLYHPVGKRGNNIQLGFGADNVNATVINNYIIGGSEPILWKKWSAATVTGNVIRGNRATINSEDNMSSGLQTTGVNFNGYNWNNNTYYDPDNGGWYWNVCNSGAAMTFAAYKTCLGFDAGSTKTTNGSGIVTFVEPSIYEPGRAHIAIYSFSGATTANVNLSTTGLTEGSTFEIRDAQNFFGSPVFVGTYHVATPIVSLPLNLTTVAIPVGLSTAPTHTSSEFNAFVVLPTGP
jgi:hypothetical protein